VALRRITFGAPAVIAAAALAAAVLLGVLIGHRPALGLVFALGIAFGALALLDLPLAIAFWIGLSFSRNLEFVWIGPTAASSAILLAWLGAGRGSWRLRGIVAHRHRVVLVAMALFGVWITSSALWAQNPGAVIHVAWTWWVAAAVATVVATTLRSGRSVRVVIGGFVAGAAISVLIGLLLSGLQPAQDAVRSAVESEPARLTGGLADPNYLAAGLVPAIVLGGALIGAVRGLLARLALAVSIAVCAIGLVATESRGGFVAALVAAVASLAVFRQRARVALGLLLVLALGAVYLAGTPGALGRITEINGGGNGRSDLWRVAWRIGETDPIVGIGLNNFVTRSQDFVREPGALRDVYLIVEHPVLVHNLYLQTYVETGVVGLGLLLAAVLGLLAVPLRAARRLQARGDPALSTVARAVFVAQLSALTALVFLSDGPDERWWLLFGLGPALLALALRTDGRAQQVPAAVQGSSTRRRPA
jgi:O-antigen ligase